MKRESNQQGFTLIELLIVIAIIAIITAVVFVALDPATRFADARNSKRWQATESILDAVKTYQVDNNGQLPSGIDTTLRMLGTDSSGCDIDCSGSGSGGGPSSGSFSDDTESKFNLGSFSDTQWDGSNSWVELDTTGLGNGSGSYTSNIKDAGSESSWDNITWVPEKPYGKELPNNAQSETAYNSGNANMTGNVLLMHMNEANGTISDSSGNGNNGTNNGAIYGVSGKFNTAMDFNGGDDYISINNDPSLNPTSAITLSVWIKWNIDPSTGNSWSQIINKNNDDQYQLQHNSNNSTFEFAVDTSSGRKHLLSTTAPQQGVWYHVVATYNGSYMRLYVNGSEENNRTHSGAINASNSVLNIGARAWTDRNFNGVIDEVAIYNRALSATEILDHYKRGALRLKHQVRSCDDILCSGESFIGPDGTGSTYYSELSNSTVSLPSFILSNVNDNQYFQYQSTFETDNSSYSPELKSIEIDYVSSGGGGSSGETTANSCLDLSTDLSTYLSNIPQDPKDGSTEKTYYSIKQIGSQGGIEVISCNAELDENISKTK